MQKFAVLWLITAVPMPKCYISGTMKELQTPNEQVIQYKKTQPNLKKLQVMVKANYVRMLDHTDNRYGKHQHFIVSLRDDVSDKEGHIEVSHSLNGYNAPTEEDLKVGPIHICGEYSTTDVNGFPKITKFKPSETGAMIHWTHQSSRDADQPSTGHAHGWIYANGKVFGRFFPGKSDSAL